MSDTLVGKKLIIGLDVPGYTHALGIIDRLGNDPWGYKLGPELVNRAPHILRDLRTKGARIFLDHKWANTPDVVAGCVKWAGDRGIDMCNIMLDGVGSETISAAAKAAQGYPDMLLLGVTVLTSRDDASLKESGVQGNRQEHVLRLATMALYYGMKGLVVSGNEILPIREQFGDHFHLVVPGTRSEGVAAGDQKQIILPAEGLRRGANHLVIASQVVKAADPHLAYRELVSDLIEAGF